MILILVTLTSIGKAVVSEVITCQLSCDDWLSAYAIVTKVCELKIGLDHSSQPSQSLGLS